MTELHLWLRHEPRTTERRTPVVPSDARRLVENGVTLTVEESPQRIFPIEEYEAVGARVVPAGSWVSAPRDTVILGLKELPDEPKELTHRHIFFGHAYKGQPGASDLLRRFGAGGGALLDLEYLVDENGRRLAAFGFWAGYLGAALAVLQHRGRLVAPLTPTSKEELDKTLQPAAGDEEFSALVIGALGRSGRGARVAFSTAGIEPTCWDLPETQNLDRPALLAHDVLVNCVLATTPSRPSSASRTSTTRPAASAPSPTSPATWAPPQRPSGLRPHDRMGRPGKAVARPSPARPHRHRQPAVAPAEGVQHRLLGGAAAPTPGVRDGRGVGALPGPVPYEVP